MSIIKLLEISTIHHPEGYCFDSTILVAENSTEVFINVPEELSNDTPYWLKAIYDYATSLESTMIRFTPFADEADVLKKFTWN
jgi:hypothetical protein